MNIQINELEASLNCEGVWDIRVFSNKVARNANVDMFVSVSLLDPYIIMLY